MLGYTAPIPDVANTFGIRCINTFELIRELGFSTVGLPQVLENYALGTEDYIDQRPLHFTTGTYQGPQVATIPIPAGAWLFLSALSGLAGIRRNSK